MKRILLLVVAAALLAAAPSADASWGPRQRLSTVNTTYLDDVALAGNARDDAVAAWQGNRAIEVAYARRGGAFGPAHEVPGGRGGRAPNVAIDEQGNALVLWSYFDNTEPERPFLRDDGCCFGARLTVRNAKTGRYERRQTLTPIGHDVGASAFAIHGGRIGVAWGQDAETRIYARFGRTGHRLGRVVHVAGGDYAVGLALLKSGPAVTYMGTSNSRDRRRLYEFRVRHRRAGPVLGVSPTFSTYAEVSVDTNARGQQAVAWSQTVGSRLSPVYAGIRAAGGRFHVRRVSRAAPAFGPRVVIARSGAALVAWNTYYGEIFAASRRPGKRFGLAQQFGATLKGYFSGLQIAVDSLGRGVIGWLQTRAGGSSRTRARGAFRSIGGRLLQSHDLGQADGMGTQGMAGLDSRGRARLVWHSGVYVRATRAHFP